MEQTFFQEVISFPCSYLLKNIGKEVTCWLVNPTASSIADALVWLGAIPARGAQPKSSHLHNSVVELQGLHKANTYRESVTMSGGVGVRVVK